MKIASCLLLLPLVSVSLLGVALFSLSDSQGEASKPSILFMDDMAHLNGGDYCWRIINNGGPHYYPSYEYWDNFDCDDYSYPSECESQSTTYTAYSEWCADGYLSGDLYCTDTPQGALGTLEWCEWGAGCEHRLQPFGTRYDAEATSSCYYV